MEKISWPILCYFLLSCLSKASLAADSLTANQSISDGQTLVSSRQVFEFGFFSPGNSKNRYVGIWYKNIPDTFVWVANRGYPVADKSGTLNFSRDGNLVLLNGNGSIVWSLHSEEGAKHPILQILDSGNLVLRDESYGGNSSYIWQSFDHPTDTLLPGMKQGWDLKTGLNRYLTPWTSTDDPSPGNYSYGVDLQGLPQLVLRMGPNKLYRSGEWYENRFSGGPVLVANSVFKPTFVANKEEVYYAFEAMDSAIYSRIVIPESGLVQHYTWIGGLQWAVLYGIQKDHCDTYNLCGPFGVCYIINQSPKCECMTGFTPKSPKDWEVFYTFGGCVRTSPLECQRGNGFVKYPGMKLPDSSNLWVNVSMGTKECREECLKNCSCTGYAVMDTHGKGKGCLMWYGALIDIRQSTSFGQDLYVRMSASELESIADSQKRRRRLKLLLVLLASFAVLILCLLLWYIAWKKKRAHGRDDKTIDNNERYLTDGSLEDEEEGKFPLFDLTTILAATKNFTFASKIGEGGFGPVYKGVLPTGEEIAVKKLSHTSRQGLQELKNEVCLISKLQHRNLVRLLGCCIEGEERMLIYEYMANRSLDAFIFDKARTQLSWKMCVEIIAGIARGLLYLHQDSILRIIHRDLKASNILLDHEMNPKISDFGMARSFGGDQTEANTGMVVGTYGYMSPEYAVDGHFSVKSDVFSFGVLVLEILSGKRNRGFYHPEHDLNLLGHAWKLWGEGKAVELLDASFGGQFPVSEALRCIHVGLLCVQQRPEDRPTMSSVLIMLDRETAVLPEPKQPGFFTERSLNETDSSSRRRKYAYSNELTVTVMEGR